MTFNLIFLLYIYYIFLFFWAILSLIGFYHLVRFGGRMFGSFFVGIVYIIGVVVILFLSYNYLSSIDWQTPVTVFSGLDSIKSLVDSPTVFK